MKHFFTFFAALLLCCGCEHCATHQPTVSNQERFEYSELEMGMIFHIILYHDNESLANDAAEAAFTRITELNAIMSDYDSESELSRFMNAPAGIPVPLSDDLFHVLSISKQLAQQTDGAFDPTLGALTQLWRATRHSGTLPPPEALSLAQSRCGWEKLILNKRDQTGTLTSDGIKLDMGAIGKGYASDCALEILKQHGVSSAFVAASGDIAVSAPPPGKPGWTIQVETFTDSGSDPEAGNYIILLKNAAISTSGDVNQFVEIDGNRYSHIVDRKTGLGLTRRAGATVVSTRAIYSDALATIGCIMSPDDYLRFLKKYPHSQARLAWLNAQGQKEFRVTKGFPQPKK